MATTPVYTTRERVKAAAGFTETNDALVDRAIAAASRIIDADCHRVFYPTTAARVFDWPAHQTTSSYRLWFHDEGAGADCISISAITTAGGSTTETVGNFNLEPANTGPPYTHLEVDLSSSSSFAAGTTHQQAISITGVWGYDNVTTSAGTTAEDMTAAETDLSMTNGGLVGVGDLITIGSERLMVTNVSTEDSTVNINANMTAAVNDQTLPVASVSGWIAGETVLVNNERMLIRDIGTVITVQRAYDGSTLAAHTSGDDIYVNRLATVERGATGSTAATSSSGAAITRQVYPSLIEQWCLAEAVVQLQQETAGWARTSGSGDNQRETIGKGLSDIRERALRAYGRRARAAVV